MNGSRERNGLGAGLDVVVPAGWSMAFWVALQMRTARAGGQQEARTLARETGRPLFPDDWPDATAGERAEDDERNELTALYARKPHNRRVDYRKLRFLAAGSARICITLRV